MKQKIFITLSLLLYITSVLLSFIFSESKRLSLSYHTRDYAFYMQFASKLLDNNILKTYSINPEGVNWLSYYGTEGIKGFHKALHFEPMKYIYAFIFKLFKSPLSVSLFLSIISFIPILYTALFIPNPSQEMMKSVLFGLVLYTVIPSSLTLPSFDLRPYILLSSLFLLTLLSIMFSRKTLETVFLFNVFFLVREEAIILGMFLILYAFAKESPKKLIVILLSSWLFWTVLTLIYFDLCSFSNVLFDLFPFTSYSIFFPLIVLTALLTIGLVLLFFIQHFKRKSISTTVLEMSVIGVIFLPLFYQFIKYEFFISNSSLYSSVKSFFFSPRYFLFFSILFALYLCFLLKRREVSNSKMLSLFFLTLFVFFISINFISKNGFYHLIIENFDNMKNSKIVFDLKKSCSTYDCAILSDYETHQAFYGFQNVFVFNRLPVSICNENERFFPKNMRFLKKLLEEKIEYIVISQKSINDLNEIIGKRNMFYEFRSNKFYKIFKRN